MNVSKIAKSSPIARELHNLKLKHATDILLGNPRSAKKNYQRFAELAVDNFETTLETPSPIKGSFSIFSKAGFNCLKYLIYNLFAKDSPAEKQFKKMMQEYKTKQKILK